MNKQKLIGILIESERDLSDMKFRMDVMQETLFEVRRGLEGGTNGQITDGIDSGIATPTDEHTELIGESCHPGCSVCGQ